MSTLQIPVTSADHIQGDPNAAVILVEYGDYQCPYCGEAYPIVKEVQDHFGEKLGLVFRNFPLTRTHPEAESAAETAEFAGTHGQFWEMHDALYENQNALGPEFYLAAAQSFGLPGAELSEALRQHAFKAKIRGDFRGGLKSGVNGTPSFFINGTRHDGAFDFESLVAAIDAGFLRPREDGDQDSS
jgi:protein-disulfide isomerase